MDVPRIGISAVAADAARSAGVAFASIRSTPFDANVFVIVAHVAESPAAFCSSNLTLSPNSSVSTSLNPFVAASSASC